MFIIDTCKISTHNVNNLKRPQLTVLIITNTQSVINIVPRYSQKICSGANSAVWVLVSSCILWCLPKHHCWMGRQRHITTHTHTCTKIISVSESIRKLGIHQHVCTAFCSLSFTQVLYVYWLNLICVKNISLWLPKMLLMLPTSGTSPGARPAGSEGEVH